METKLRPSLGADDLNTEKAPIKMFIFCVVFGPFPSYNFIFLRFSGPPLLILFVLIAQHMELMPLYELASRKPAA